MLFARPKIAELVFQLYGRTLHPELFEVHRTKRIERGDPVQRSGSTNQNSANQSGVNERSARGRNGAPSFEKAAGEKPSCDGAPLEGASPDAPMPSAPTPNAPTHDLGLGYEATIQITSSGHLVTWRRGKLVLAEVATSSHHPMPEKRRLMSARIDGERTETVDCRGGVRYEVNFALETVSSEAFAAYQQQVDLAALETGHGASGEIGSSGLVHRYDAMGRVGAGAMSYVDVQARDRSLLIRALHTFPDDCAIVRSRSVFRLPS